MIVLFVVMGIGDTIVQVVVVLFVKVLIVLFVYVLMYYEEASVAVIVLFVVMDIANVCVMVAVQGALYVTAVAVAVLYVMKFEIVILHVPVAMY